MRSFAVALCCLLAIVGSAAAQTIATSYSWTSTGPIISAKSDSTHNIIAVKDPSAVYYNGQWIIYASDVNSGGNYNMEYLNIGSSWSNASSATPYFMDNTPGFGGYHTAPQVFYFAPQNKWYLIFQSGQPQYSTNSDPTKPQNWTQPQNFFASQPASVSNWIDFWVICDSQNCYLFFAGDNGNFYRSSTPIGDFPNGFNEPVIVYSESNAFDLFEADNVYFVEGTGAYLADIECLGPQGQRYFRALTATNLGGTWTPLGNTNNFPTPFLGQDNVTFQNGVSAWTTSFSSGGLLIDGNDQTDSVNPENLVFLYQGANPTAYANDSYGLIPWQLGLATSNANSCTPTAITPYISVNGTWTAESSATASSTSTAVDLGPQPLSGGSWSWSGPNGFTSTSREIDNIALSAGNNIYTATYTNSCGAKGSQAFVITVGSGSGTPITPYVSVNGGANWTEENTATVSSASAVVDLGPQPLSGGSWSWSGPNGFTSTLRQINNIPLNAGTNTYVATYTNSSGAQTTESFVITVTSSISTTNYYQIVNEASGACIDDTGAGITNGTAVQQYSCSSGNHNQEWLFTAASSGYYEVTTYNSSTASWNVIGPSKNPGTGVQLYTYYGGLNEQFEPVLQSNGYYELIDRNSGLCLNFPTTSNGQQLQINSCNGSSSEMFKLNQL